MRSRGTGGRKIRKFCRRHKWMAPQRANDNKIDFFGAQCEGRGRGCTKSVNGDILAILFCPITDLGKSCRNLLRRIRFIPKVFRIKKFTQMILYDQILVNVFSHVPGFRVNEGLSCVLFCSIALRKTRNLALP